MMENENALVCFQYEGQPVRTVTGEDGEPRFVVADVCAVLDLVDGRTSVNQLDDDERDSMPVIDSMGRKQEMLVITESGLYSLVLRSRKPEAKKFKRWITSDVLPSIRKHGGYLTPEKLEEALTNPDVLIRLATDLKAEREKRMRLEERVAEDAPKVIFADAVAASKTTLLVGDVAKLLRQNGVMVGQQRLFEWLRENGWLMKIGSSRNMPTQAAMERGFFEVKETTICKPDGSIHISKTPKVTGRGQRFIVNCFIGESPAA